MDDDAAPTAEPPRRALTSRPAADPEPRLTISASSLEDHFALLEAAPVGVALLGGSDGQVVRANRRLCRLLGYPGSALEGLALAELCEPSVTEIIARAQTAVDGEPVSAEQRCRRRDGRELWLLLSASKLGEDETGVPYFLCHFVDIDERRREEQRLRGIVETSQEGLCEFDGERRITFVNPRMAEMLGWPREEIAGTLIDHHLCAGHRFERKTGVQEVCLRRKDGSRLWARLSTTLTEDGGFSLVSDITGARRTREELRQAVDLQRALARNLPDTVAMLFDRDLRYMLVEGQNAYLAARGDLLGRRLVDLELPSVLRTELAQRYRDTLAGQEHRFNTLFDDRVFAVTLSPVRDENGGVYAGLMVARDISEAHEARARLAHLSENDQLTGLPNRDSFRTALEEALGAARRGLPAALMLLDMDNFKSINDSLGHDAGDELLTVIAERLRRAVRPGDLVSRLSGDEFAVLMHGIELEHDVKIAAERILSVFAEPVDVGDQELFPTASVGVARIPQDADSTASALKAADVAMYAAKRAGRNLYRVFQPRMADRVAARLRVSSELHRSVMRGELELHYQPQLALEDERLVSLEALVRWRHPSRGLLMPAQFIAVAEETGLIDELGDWVLRRACQDLAAWRSRGITEARVAVNVSIHQLRQITFPDLVAEALADSGLHPTALELEITESALMERQPAAALLEDLRATGVVIAIDDFGTGYSSLSRLRRLPIDLLKVDRAFVTDADRDPDASALVRSIVALAETLGMSALAEGVERPEQREILIEHGCRLAAGWLWTHALPVDALETWLATRPSLPPRTKNGPPA